MKKEIIVVDKEKGVYRVTTPDERFYLTEGKDKETGLPTFLWKPSVTWIAGYYPKGIAFYKWLANKGWDEAESIKSSAGDKGSRVHNCITNLIAGGTVNMEDKYLNNSTGLEEELTVEEYECLMAFTNWANEVKPQFILSEVTVESEKYNYAGTVDCVAKIGEQVYIIDFKTGQYIWPEYELQISAYKQALKEMGRKVDKVKLAFLQVGYKRNKKGYKFTEVEDKFELFLHAKAIWTNECGGQKPKQSEYPLSLKIDAPEAEPSIEPPVLTQQPKTPQKSKSEAKQPNKLTK
jgi:hypothetical protein